MSSRYMVQSSSSYRRREAHYGAATGNTYDTEFEVYADGYRFKLVDPYGTPKLCIRRPGAAEEGMYIIIRT